MKLFEVWTGDKWSAVTLRQDGEIVYVSNGAKVGNGMRITRVSDAPNQAPIAGDISFTGTVTNG